jgi:lysophospholipase L1-like esterase
MTLRIRTIPLFALLLCLLCLNTNPAVAATPSDHWVGTWAASPLAEPNTPAYGSADTTLREIVHISLGGSSVRIIVSNEFGIDSLTIGAAQIALSTGASDIDTTASSTLTFSGRPSITIPSGALAVSDPVSLSVPAFANLAVSLFIPAQTIRQLSIHGLASQIGYKAPGNLVTEKTFSSPETIDSWPFLKGVDVMASGKSASIVALGDSITDGAHSTRGANARWPDFLARRLQANKKTAQLGVLNEGINGNRILHDGWGPNALSRFDRDVLAQAGVKYLIILESINDIGAAQNPVNPHDVVTADDLIAGLTQLAVRAHTHGIKVFGATLTPYVGAGYASPAGEKMREAVNQWIRNTNQFDGVIDFDKVTRDPSNPETFSPLAGSPDHLHPGDSGYKLMGDSIDMKLFTTK